MDAERALQATQHVRAHFGNEQGFVTLQSMTDEGMKSRTVRLANVAGALDDLPNEGTYFSLNSFGRFDRKAKSLWFLHASYVDIDCEKAGLSPESVLETLEREVFGAILPCPSYVLMSGRGLWCVWTILPRKNDKRGANVQRWRETQAYLIDVLRPYGADPTSNDVTRTCRLSGSVNQKCSKDVVLKVFQGEGRFSLVDLHDFASEQASARCTPERAPRPVIDLRTLFIEESERKAGAGHVDDLPP